MLREDEEVDVVWSSMVEQNDPIHRMDQVIREEILPGEREFLNIIKGAGRARKDPDTVCIHCGGSFANRENRLKHTECCLRGIHTHWITKASKDYICIRCSKSYASKKFLI